MTRPLGIRSNNPGNIRRDGTRWVGQDLSWTGPMAKFKLLEYGIRASALLLRNYQRKHGLRTVRGVITRWAPPVENDTEAYIASVCATTGFTAGQRLDLNTPVHLRALLAGIFRHENGRKPDKTDWISGDEIRAGIALLPKP